MGNVCDNACNGMNVGVPVSQSPTSRRVIPREPSGELGFEQHLFVNAKFS